MEVLKYISAILLIIFYIIATIWIIYSTIELIKLKRNKRNSPNQDEEISSYINVRDKINRSLIVNETGTFESYIHKESSRADRIWFEILSLKSYKAYALSMNIIIENIVNIANVFVDDVILPKEMWNYYQGEIVTCLTISIKDKEDIWILENALYINYTKKGSIIAGTILIRGKEESMLKDMVNCYKGLVS